MVERFFLDGIDAEARRTAIGREHNRIARAPAHETQPALPLVELAVARADITLEPAVRKRMSAVCAEVSTALPTGASAIVRAPVGPASTIRTVCVPATRS